MDLLYVAWAIALVATVWTLMQGLIRAYVHRSQEIDHTRTMRISATVALSVGTVALVCFLALTVAIMLR